jgi:hypothetical protein
VASTVVKQHWTRVAALGCILTGRDAEIAHCHGGSIKLLGSEFRPGWGQKQNDWLVLPLAPEIHRIGPDSLDGGPVDQWEQVWDSQLRLLLELSWQLGYSVYEKAGIDPAVVELIVADLNLAKAPTRSS